MNLEQIVTSKEISMRLRDIFEAIKGKWKKQFIINVEVIDDTPYILPCLLANKSFRIAVWGEEKECPYCKGQFSTCEDCCGSGVINKNKYLEAFEILSNEGQQECFNFIFNTMKK